jgi:integrase
MMTHNVPVYLIRRSRPLPSGKRGKYWMLRWFGSDGKPLHESLGRCDELTRREADERRRAKELALNSGKVRRDRLDAKTLSEFRTMYLERRAQGDSGKGYVRGAPKLEPSTLAEHDMTMRYMLAHFGENCSLASVTMNDAERWVDVLKAGNLSGAREPVKREYTVGEQTIRKHIRNAKAIYNWALRFGFVNANPFANFDGKPLPSDANEYVATKSLDKLLSDIVPPSWRALFALCRLAGLRLGEALALPWSGKALDRRGESHRVGVDWDMRRLHLVAEKTGMYRVVPMCPKLHDVLLDVFSKAAEGADTITGLSANNITRQGKMQVKAAGLTPWPKLYQALRSSCENDWKQSSIAEATYCTWMGHSATVSRAHYVAPTDAEFAIVTRAA